MNQQTALTNITRIGTVSSVDVETRLVRVEFADKQDVDGKPLVSAELKVLQNQPLITVEEWVMELGEEEKWDYKTEYNSHPRDLDLGESYVQKPYAELKDVIKNERIIRYEKRETISEGSPLTGICSCPGTIQGLVCPLRASLNTKSTDEP